MSDIPQVTLHYFDGRESEVRNMTEEEISELKTGLLEDVIADVVEETPIADEPVEGEQP